VGGVVLLVGHDFHYTARRHYFAGLSETDGEYPDTLRKYSTFDGLIKTYRAIGFQTDLPPIYNCSPDSALPWFPMRRLEEFIDD
jgi:hypothetical protein